MSPVWPRHHIFKKRIGWFAVIFFLTVSFPAQPKTAIIPDMVLIKVNCFTMGSEEFVARNQSIKYASILFTWGFTKSLKNNSRKSWVATHLISRDPTCRLKMSPGLKQTPIAGLSPAHFQPKRNGNMLPGRALPPLIHGAGTWTIHSPGTGAIPKI